MREEEFLRKIWYAGLNAAFLKTRGPMAAAGCHDDPRIRMGYYAVAAVVFTVMGAGVALVIPLLTGMLWLAGGCVAVALLVWFQAAVLCRAFFRVRAAVREGGDVDRADPFRFRVMRRALSWGLEKGLVVRNGEDGYAMRERP